MICSHFTDMSVQWQQASQNLNAFKQINSQTIHIATAKSVTLQAKKKRVTSLND
jgi:hypothetical protein